MTIKMPVAAWFFPACLIIALLAPKGSLGAPGLKVPPGHLPPPGQCKLWYSNRPPGQQPPPDTCDSLLAKAPPNAVVVDHAGKIVLDLLGTQQDPPNSALPSSPAPSPGGTRFVDNGDGTVTDNETGLMWEMKLAADGTDGGNCADPAQNARDIHCVNNLYLWTDLSDGNNANPDGEAFTVFLAELNQDTANDAESICFADHCDWRIPLLLELRTILTSPCNGAPCIDPAFGPTMASTYWSSTSWSAVPASAWVIKFDTGSIDTGSKSTAAYVRAVRTAR